MVVPDFFIKYDPKIHDSDYIARRILFTIITKRLKAHKPAVMFISGDSGEGKSLAALKVQEVLCEILGLNLIDVLEDINVFTPLEYPKKLDILLHPKTKGFEKEREKMLKIANILCVHEARTLITAKMWHNFVNQAIGDVNAMSRKIKPMCFMIISQFIRDISTDIRYTLNYYCKVTRPLQGKSKLYINVMWKDDRDLEKPKLRRRTLKGYLVYPSGKHRLFTPKYIELKKPSKDVEDLFDKLDFDSKGKIIHQKMEKMIKEMETQVGSDNKKVPAMVDWYIKNHEQLLLIGKYGKRGFKPKKEIKDMHDLTSDEFKDFTTLLNNKMKENNIMGMGEDA